MNTVKNKGSFTTNNQPLERWERWTKTECEKIFNNALLLSYSELTLTNIANKLNVYTPVFDYLVNKYPRFESIKKAIKANLENNLVVNALTNKINTTMTIFILKNNYGYKDKVEIDKDFYGDITITIDGEEIN